MNKHTLGPWELEIITSAYVTACDGTHIADVHHGSTATAKAEGSANARLIAAAPELLEALEFVIRGVPDTWEGVQKARAAIAKATKNEE